MIWLGWRQQRTETLIAAAIVAVLAAVLIPTGIQVASAYNHDGLSSCSGSFHPGCDLAIGNFLSRFNAIGGLIDWVTLIPGVIGVLLAAPFIAQFENGTYRLDWTQSITRERWVAGKLGLAVATALGAAIVLTLLITWWRAPFVHVQGRVNNGTYDSEGTVVASYALFALGLGLAVGAVWRRAVPSLVTAFAAYFAVRLFVDTWLRQRLVDPVSRTWQMGTGHEPNLNKDWVLSQFPVDAHGHPIASSLSCPDNAGGTCKVVDQGGAGFLHAVYHPNSHFWALQGIETAMFGAAAIALIGFAAWWTLKRIR